MPFELTPLQLQGGGPVILTGVGITNAHLETLSAAGQTPPEPVQCRLLIDTGASKSLVRHDIAERAGLKLISSNTPVRGIGVDTTGRTYMGSILFSCESRSVPGTRYTIAVEAMIASGNLPAELIDGLIGRDVLSHFEFLYNGYSGKFSLRFFKHDKFPRSQNG